MARVRRADRGRPVIRLGASGVSGFPAARALAGLRRDFERRHYVLLPGLLEPDLLARVLAAVDATRFRPSEEAHGIISMEGSISHEADFLLTFCLQHPRFFEFVEAVTGCPPVRSFAGRLIRSRPGRGYLGWHSDAEFDDRRLASISLNLGRIPYRGGLLQFRGRGERAASAEIANVGCGDAVLFAAYGESRHRNTPVKGAEPKTAFSGWFYADRGAGPAAMFARKPAASAGRGRP